MRRLTPYFSVDAKGRCSTHDSDRGFVYHTQRHDHVYRLVLSAFEVGAHWHQKLNRRARLAYMPKTNDDDDDGSEREESSEDERTPAVDISFDDHQSCFVRECLTVREAIQVTDLFNQGETQLTRLEFPS
jgi:hypothetical protein